jgi:hypothetical protein
MDYHSCIARSLPAVKESLIQGWSKLLHRFMGKHMGCKKSNQTVWAEGEVTIARSLRERVLIYWGNGSGSERPSRPYFLIL